MSSGSKALIATRWSGSEISSPGSSHRATRPRSRTRSTSSSPWRHCRQRLTSSTCSAWRTSITIPLPAPWLSSKIATSTSYSNILTAKTRRVSESFRTRPRRPKRLPVSWRKTPPASYPSWGASPTRAACATSTRTRWRSIRGRWNRSNCSKLTSKQTWTSWKWWRNEKKNE